MKIFAFPSHTNKEKVSGVDFARIIQPMSNLAKEKGYEVKIYDPQNDLDGKIKWKDVGKDYDVVYMNYLNARHAFAAIGTYNRMFNKKMIIDIDDDLWGILPDNPAYSVFGKRSDGIRTITAILNEADHITCTNTHLRNVILHNTNKSIDQVSIIPNAVDFNVYDRPVKRTKSHQFRIIHFGSTTHFQSLAEENFTKAMNRIMKEYPNVTFTTIGALVPKFRMKWGPRYINKHGDIDVFKWIKKMPDMLSEGDLLVVPLTNNTYNRSKSSIKFLEASAVKLPGCWQNIRQYKDIVRDGENGFLCNTYKEWYKAIKSMIDLGELREQIAEQAYDDVKSNHTIQKLLPEYKELFEKVLTE